MKRNLEALRRNPFRVIGVNSPIVPVLSAIYQAYSKRVLLKKGFTRYCEGKPQHALAPNFGDLFFV